MDTEAEQSAGHSQASILLPSMAKRFKLKCRLFISSFRFCRPKQHRPLTFPESFHNNRQFPANPKSCGICYPNPPSPPPSTPVGFFAGHVMAKSASVCCSCKLKSNAPENRAETEHKVFSEGTEALMKSLSDEKKGNERSKRDGRFVEVKRSKEPQEDFKRSMIQMILEEEIFEAKGLEELLHCYLTLNSPEYHRIIVGAFSEVWEYLLYNSHSSK